MSRCYDYKNNLQTPNLKSTNGKRATRWGGGGLGREVGRGATSTAAGSHKLMKFYLLMQWGKLHRSAVPTLAGNNESVSCLKALGYCPSHARWKNSISSQSAVGSRVCARCPPAVPQCPPLSVQAWRLENKLHPQLSHQVAIIAIKTNKTQQGAQGTKKCGHA